MLPLYQKGRPYSPIDLRKGIIVNFKEGMSCHPLKEESMVVAFEV